MLIKALFTDSKNYERSLKLRRLWAIGMLCIGLVGFACYVLLVPSSDLSDYVQGFYLGAASGITAGALFLLVRTQYLLTHPRAQRQAKIKETDEQEMQIARTSAQIAGALTIFAAAVASGLCKPDTDITVKLRGGDLVVNYNDERILMSGDTNLVYVGEFEF